MIHDAPPRYRAYLLRCWEVRSPDRGGLAAWRFSLEEPGTGEKHGFADLEAVHDFLQAQLSEADSAKQ